MSDMKKYGVVEKSVSAPVELEKINAQALVPLTEDQVFTFRVAAANNQVDRDFEQFSEKALNGLSKLFVGRTILMDHNWSAAGQTARIYDACTERRDGTVVLMLSAYMIRNAQTEPTISAIEGGILREVSVGCAVKSAKCSICGADKVHVFCEHRPGREYDGKLCTVTLDEPADAYECSFVAVPAQRDASVVKKYGGEGNKRTTQTTENVDPVSLALLDLEEKRYLKGDYTWN